MALFSQASIRAAGRRAAASAGVSAQVQLRQLAGDAPPDQRFDIFLSHSYLDSELVLGLKDTIEAMHHSVYVDWVEDDHLVRSEVSRATAELLRRRMSNSRSLFFATSGTSASSKWMPWESGYFDGLKGKVAICPLTTQQKEQNEYSGQEYLGLYPYVANWVRQGDSVPQLWIHETPSKYVNFGWWVKNGVPHEHTA